MTLLYDNYRESRLTESPSVKWQSDVIRVAIGRTSAYTVNSAHVFKSSCATVQDATGAVASVTTAAGQLDYADPVFAAVASGAALDFIATKKDTGGADTANPLLMYQDGFSIIPNGGDITAVEDSGPNRVLHF